MTNKTLYLEVSEETIAPYVILSGDPRRVEKIITQLDDVKEVSVNREFHTYTGTYKGMPITVSSTGIGGPSAAIALEEVYEAGAKVVVRLGTVMGLQDNLGKFFVPVAAMRRENTSSYYVEKGYPAVANFDLVSVMNDSITKHDREFENGIVCSTDGYYTEMKESRLSKEMKTDVVGMMAGLDKFNIAGLDMETSTLLTLGNLMGIKVCSVTLATVTDNLNQAIEPKKRVEEERVLATIVLDGLLNHYNKNDKK